MTEPSDPTGMPGAAPRPAMPDLSDLIADPGKPPKPANPRNRTLVIGVVGGLVLLGAGFGIGHATTSGGPATLAAAIQQAQAGKLPCGTLPATSAAGGTTAGGTAGGFGGGFGGRAGASFLVARLCQNGNGTAGTGAGGTGAGGGGGGGGGFAGRGGLGALFGPGTVNGTISSISGNAITLQTRAGTVTIALPASAKVTKTTTGSIKDLGNGMSVAVSTTQDSSGNRTATSVFVLPTPPTGQAG